MTANDKTSPVTRANVVVAFPIHRIKARARTILKPSTRRVSEELCAIQGLMVPTVRADVLSDRTRTDGLAAILAAR